MPNMDDLLEQRLKALEKGYPVEEVIATLPPEGKELADLIRLAARVRNMPHPAPAATRPARSAAAAAHPARRPLWRWDMVHLHLSRLGTAGLFAAVLLLVVFGVYLAGPFGADSVTLAEATGLVEVRQPDESAWRAVSAGELLKRGDQIRVSDGSGAVLEYFEGTRSQVEAGTQLTLMELNGGWGNSLQVELRQESGRTMHQVIPLRGQRSFYRVLTPTGEAIVHGTTFEVDVQTQEKARFAVENGKVQVNYQGQQVFITSGQTTLAGPKAALSDPTYQFSVSGALEFSSVDRWTVSGVTFSVNEETVRPAFLKTGDPVVVTGRVLSDGERIADRIEIKEVVEAGTFLTGVLEVMEGDTWVIGDATILVTADTVLAEGLQVGLPVRAEITVQADGRWQALSIEPLELPEEEPVEVTLTPPAHPELEFVPEEFELTTCETEFDLPVSLQNLAGQDSDAATGLELGYLYEDGQSAVESLVLTPSSWDALAAGEQADFSVQLNLAPDWFETVKKVKLRINIAAEDHRDFYGSKVTITLNSCKAEEETVTPTPSASPTVTETEPTPEVTETPDGDDICTGTEQHPTGMRLAEEHGVPYEEIMGWFCQRPANGFGEIDLAYNLAEQYDLTVEEIFAMRDQKLGWGQIKKSLEAAAEPTDDNLPPGQQKTKENKPQKTKLPPGQAKKTPQPPRP